VDSLATPLAARVVAERGRNEPVESVESLRAYRAQSATSANLFAVSATMSIRRCSFFCRSGLCDKRGLARLSCDERSAPPVEPVVHAHLDDIDPLGGGRLYRKNETGRNVVGQAQQMRGVCSLGAKINVIVLDEGGPILHKRIFHACAKRPSCPPLGRAVGRYARLGVIPTHDIKWSCRVQTVLAKLPCPTTLGIDQSAINCCADSTSDGAEARNLIIAGKTDTRSGNCTCIEATPVAFDVSPMSVGLDSKYGPLDLPVSSNLASKKTRH
jgi:hypothetical protein